MADEPKSCPICGHYQTIAATFAGYRCIDAGHWQAAGLITPRDYYLMAKIAAWAKKDLNLRLMNQAAANSPEEGSAP